MSKVIFKLTFNHPNIKTAASRSVDYVRYIATRPGVEKSLTETDLEKELKDEAQASKLVDEDYLQYIHERPKSHGLFGQDGVEDLSKVEEEVKQVKSFIWRGIVSIKEEDAARLGFLEKEKWQDLLRSKVFDMAQEMEIRPTNLRWVGAVHMEKGHPHAHIMFWERTPERTIGIVRPKVLDRIRKIYTDAAFEEERSDLLNTKNAIRDLMLDMGVKSISEISKLLKELKQQGVEIKSLSPDNNKGTIPPRIHTEQEEEIIKMLKDLSAMMPGKGRIALKFMPEDVKEAVRKIADHLLEQPHFSSALEQNLQVTEKLTSMYTTQPEDIQKVRDNAYRDIRDRICQIILRGAAEWQKKDKLHIDDVLASDAVAFIEGMEQQIDIRGEKLEVMQALYRSLGKSGMTPDKIQDTLKSYAEVQGISLSDEELQMLKQEAQGDDEIRIYRYEKKIDQTLSSFKALGIEEEEAFKLTDNVITKDLDRLKDTIKEMVKEGLLYKAEGKFHLTNKGIDEFIIVKNFDASEKAVLAALDRQDPEKPIDIDGLMENQEVFDNIHNQDPKEVELGNFDKKVREYFGDENRLTMPSLEEAIYEKYSEKEIEADPDKPEKEFDIIKNRIDKLALYGFLSYDRETGVYSWTNEALAEVEGLQKGMEYSLYDANVTLNYIDEAGGLLTREVLEERIYKEVANSKAIRAAEQIKAVLDSGAANSYIHVDQQGIMAASEEGKRLGMAFGALGKYFNKAKGELTLEKLKEYLNEGSEEGESDKKYASLTNMLKEQVAKGHIVLSGDIYRMDANAKEISKALYSIYKAGGSVDKNDILGAMEKTIPNEDAKRHYDYMTKRLNFLKQEGYLKGSEKEYSITDKGEEKRKDLLQPKRVWLRDKLEYLNKLGVIDSHNGAFKVSNKYYKLMEQKLDIKKSGQVIASKFEGLAKELVDMTQNKIDPDKIHRALRRITLGRYHNRSFDTLKTDYEEIRSSNGITDRAAYVVERLSCILMAAGKTKEEVRHIIQAWNIKSESHMDEELLNDHVDKAEARVQDKNIWGKTFVLTREEWERTFGFLGIKEPPKWFYKGNFQPKINNLFMAHLIGDIWRGAWNTLQKQRMQAEAEVEMLKNSQIRQNAMSSPTARKEQKRKSNDRALYKENNL